jgi:hypothetical protein
VPDSNIDHAAAKRFVAACHGARVQRVLVIGGEPEARQSLVQLLLALEIRAIDGVGELTDDHANRLADWADVVALWGPTELHRSVTEHFVAGRLRSTVVVVDKPGIAALLDETSTFLPHNPAR